MTHTSDIVRPPKELIDALRDIGAATVAAPMPLRASIISLGGRLMGLPITAIVLLFPEMSAIYQLVNEPS